jgi:hypothetical protein
LPEPQAAIFMPVKMTVRVCRAVAKPSDQTPMLQRLNNANVAVLGIFPLRLVDNAVTVLKHLARYV